MYLMHFFNIYILVLNINILLLINIDILLKNIDVLDIFFEYLYTHFSTADKCKFPIQLR